MRRLALPVLAACALLAFAVSTASAGPAPAPRVVGGHDAPAGSWPSIVEIVNTTRNGGVADDWAQEYCGGTLLTASWVLTAQHCTVDEGTGTALPLADFQVMYGSHRLDNTGTRVGITQIVRQPGFSLATYANDLALMRLATPIPGASTLPVTIPALSALWAPGTPASVAGWGSRNEAGTDYPVNLQELTGLPIVSDSDCRAVYPSMVPAVEVCAGDLARGGIDTCQGDSGGPLVVPDAAGHPVLVGDTSYGTGCAEAGNPGVYGEIAGMRALIDATLGWTTGASLSAPALTFPSGGAQTATLTSTGDAPLSVSGVALSGPGAHVFHVDRDGCTNVVLTTGQSCSVDLSAATISDGGTMTATLALTGDGAAGTKTVDLTDTPASPAPPVTTTTTTTTPTAPPTSAPENFSPSSPIIVPVAPELSVRLISGHRAALKAYGALTAELKFTRSVRDGRKTVKETLATATVKFPKKGTKTITLTLTAAGRSALRGGKRVKVTGTARIRGNRTSDTKFLAGTLR